VVEPVSKHGPGQGLKNQLIQRERKSEIGGDRLLNLRLRPPAQRFTRVLKKDRLRERDRQKSLPGSSTAGAKKVLGPVGEGGGSLNESPGSKRGGEESAN